MDAGHRQAGKITLGVVTRTLRRPMWWLCVSIYVCLIQASYWTGYMSLWLKAAKVTSAETGRLVAKYSVEQINVYPTFVNLSEPFTGQGKVIFDEGRSRADPVRPAAVAALSSWIGTTLAGSGLVKPWQMYSFAQFFMLFAAIVLTVWHVSDALKFVAFYVGVS